MPLASCEYVRHRLKQERGCAKKWPLRDLEIILACFLIGELFNELAKKMIYLQSCAL